jgi:uncharacterized protein (DUF305 family)
MRVTYDNLPRALRAAGVAVLAAGLLSGCFGSSADSDTTPEAVTTGPPQIQPGRPGEPNQTGFFTPPEDQWNEADAKLATDMIPHHRQALDMSSLAPERAQNAKVKAIAERIHAEQEPEIELLETWLRDRGYGVPATPGADAHGHDDSAHAGMPGMATPEEMDALAAASGEEFDRMFLELMIRHHQGALDMIGVWAGKGIEIRMDEIASEINVTQVGEIRRMEDIIAELDGKPAQS